MTVRSRNPILRLALPLLVLVMGGGRAEAHLVTTGLGPLYDGIGHLVLSPEDWLPVVALGLYVGLRGANAARSALLALPLAWLVAGCLGLFVGSAPGFPVASATCIILGLLIATDCAMPVLLVAALTTVTGGLHGFLDGVAMRAPGAGVLSLLGTTVMAAVVMALISGFVVSLKAVWARIVVRIAGSWTAATGLFMLGWWLRRR